ncbi:uncharacterized protein DS421_2g44100 [Arachis hypogaea]|nr:uncharacterized protein DS421_2g44100 [Arachis hypogaea]
MVLSLPAGIMGAIALFSSPIPSHLSSSRHCRTKEALTPWHHYCEGCPVDRHLFKPCHLPFLPHRHFPSSFAAGKR